MWHNQKTFQQLVDEMTLPVVFSGTDVDQATQEALLEWLFDYPLCDAETTFLRYFRRKLNNVYPMYQQRLRVSTVKGTMDPFVIDFMERVKASSLSKQDSINNTKTSTTEGTDGATTNYSSNQRRDPHLTTTTGDQIRKIHNISYGETADDTTAKTGRTTGNGTETRDLTNSVNSTNTETRDLSTDTTQDTTERRNLTNESSSTSESEGTTRSFGVNYPEANLDVGAGGPGHVPSSVSNYPANINYISNEVDGLSSSSSSGEDTHTESGSVTTGMNSTVDEDGTVTTRLLSTTADDGTVTTVSTGTSTDNETFSHRGSKTDSGSESLDNTSTTTELGFETNTVTDVTTVSRTNEKEGTETFRGTNAGSSTGSNHS